MSKNVGNIDGMNYEITGKQKISPKQVALSAAGELSTLSLAWLLIKRHKVLILSVGNVLLVLNWAIPSWTTMVRSIIH